MNRLKKQGYIVSEKCPLCGEEVDSVEHRLPSCMHPLVCKARQEVIPQDRVRFHLSNIGHEDKEISPRANLLWSKGLILAVDPPERTEDKVYTVFEGQTDSEE